MRKLVVSEFLTLDGVMEDPGGDSSFKYGGWSRPYSGEKAMMFKFEELFGSGALLQGRVTYDGFAKAWPIMQGTGEFGEKMNGVPKYVVSASLKTAGWNNSHIVRGDVAAEVMKLKQAAGKDLLVNGSAMLVQLLAQHDLVDEYRFLVYPVVLGTGKHIFKDGVKIRLKLIEARSFETGPVLLRYEPERNK
jgi:dihydrofolate reductase